MKHLGDITKINGAEIPVVDVITGGSPCQDLSVAGARKGLEGERSGLFMEQVRVVKEMREHDKNSGRADEFIRPRYMVWENVKGALSSPGKDRKGEDFKAVLEEVIRIAEPQAPDLSVPKNGWTQSGLIYDDMGRWSVAWRVHNAKFWSIPQNRERLCLVADFNGTSAGEILFERKGLSGDNQSFGEKGETTSRGIEGSSDESDSG